MQNNGPDFGNHTGMPGPLDIKPEDIKFDEGPSSVNDFQNGKFLFNFNTILRLEIKPE